MAAEHVVMAILTLVRNQIPAHEQIIADDWNVAQIARNAFDLEGKVVGTVGAGRIGYRVLQRLQGFDCKELLWFDYSDLPPGVCMPPSVLRQLVLILDAAKAIKARRVDTLEELVQQCDVVTIVSAPTCPMMHELMVRIAPCTRRRGDCSTRNSSRR